MLIGQHESVGYMGDANEALILERQCHGILSNISSFEDSATKLVQLTNIEEFITMKQVLREDIDNYKSCKPNFSNNTDS